MKYLIAAAVFLSLVTVTLVTTPASQAGTNVWVNVGGPARGYYNRAVCPYGYCNSPYTVYPQYPQYYGYPQYYPPVATTPVTVYPVIVDTTGVVDNIYGPGASAARRLAPLRNSNIYHGW